MATTETTPSRTSEPRRVPAPRRIRVAVRRVNPWSVLRFSLVFYFSLMLVMLVGLIILYAFLGALGILDTLSDLFAEFGFGSQSGGFTINGFFIFRTLFLIGIISVVVWSALTVFFAFLYNLIADLVGGIEVTLSERR